MELTPIRVRGKRRAQTQSASSSRASTPSSTTSVSKRSGKSSTGSTRTSKRRKTVSPLSQLEQLPAELLQCILLYSMNISLPQSSPRLAHKLSSEHVFLDFSLKALWREEGQNPGSENDEAYIQLQSQLLRCRFFTWQFYKTYVQRVNRLPRGGARAVDLDNPECFGPQFCYSNGPAYLYLAPGCHIPEKLLKGPWTPDKIRFLGCLVWLGARIDWTGSSAGETATQGLWDAIREGATNAVASLTCPKYDAVKPTIEMVRFAVKDCGCDQDIVNFLMSPEWGVGADIDYDDPELWAWTERAKARGNPEAVWLRQRLSMVVGRVS